MATQTRATRATRTNRRRPRAAASDLKDLSDLTAAERRELNRRLKDLDDPTRYRLVAHLSPSATLYYVMSDDTYVLNEPAFATLFKRRAAAAAVKGLLENNVRIEKCTIDRHGRARERPRRRAR